VRLDIRIPIGWLFTLIGALLVIEGLLTGAPTTGAARGLNINAWWGGVLVVFGVGMLLLARRRAATLCKEAG
jgi:hypothetical protein